MRLSTLPVVALAAVATAVPMKREAQTDIDAVILQYALTLEHLENAFYKKAVSTWDEKSFTDAGFPASVYNGLKYITHDEEGHVVFLEKGLTAAGAMPVKACEYKFPMTTPKEFIALASVIEGVGVSAYLGAAPNVTSKAYLTAAGSILVTEALHQSGTRAAAGKIPYANVFGTPLGFNAVYSIASGFIVSCPKDNMALPVKAYPALTLNTGLPTAQNVSISLTPATAPSGDVYATFVSGLQIIPVKPSSTEGGVVTVDVPAMAEGQSYVFLTKDGSGSVNDDTVAAGPAILEITPSSPTFDVTIQ